MIVFATGLQDWADLIHYIFSNIWSDLQNMVHVIPSFLKPIVAGYILISVIFLFVGRN